MRSGPEVIHFPMRVGEQFFSELAGERLVTKRNKYGVPTKVWERTQTKNEALDAAALALAALRLVAPTPAVLDQWARRTQEAAGTIQQPADATTPGTTTPPAPKRATASRRRRVARSTYLSDWR